MGESKVSSRLSCTKKNVVPNKMWKVWSLLARPAFRLLRPRSSNRLEAEVEAEEEEEDKVLILKPLHSIIIA